MTQLPAGRPNHVTFSGAFKLPRRQTPAGTGLQGLPSLRADTFTSSARPAQKGTSRKTGLLSLAFLAMLGPGLGLAGARAGNREASPPSAFGFITADSETEWTDKERENLKLLSGLADTEWTDAELEHLQLLTGLTADDVSAYAGWQLEVLDARMDELARKIDPKAKSWQEVMPKITAHSPKGREAILAEYEKQMERSKQFLLDQGLFVIGDETFPAIEHGSSFPLAYYSLLEDTVYINTDADPKLNCFVCIPPIAVHEGIPGHFLDDTVNGGSNAFTAEGWGLYTEMLMIEQGFYQTPQEELAALRNVLWRAARSYLTVEVQAERMTDAEAQRYMEEEILLSSELAANEVYRMNTNPMSMIGYFIGGRQIQALRDEVLKRNPDMTLAEFHQKFMGHQRSSILSVAHNDFGVTLPKLAPPDEEDRRMVA